jgi:hypothetical protein
LYAPRHGYSGELVQKHGKAILKLEGDNVQADSVTIGLADELKVTVSIEGGTNLTVEPIRQITPSSDWHERRRSDVDKVFSSNGSSRWQQSFYIDSLKLGDVPLPIALLRFRDPPGRPDAQTIKWTPITVHVTTEIRNHELSQLRDIAPPEELPPKPSWLPTIFLGLGVGLLVCLLVGAGVLLRRHALHERPVSLEQWAHTELQAVVRTKLDEQNDLNGCHLGLSNVFRRYLEMRFQLAASARTTAELLTLIRDNNLIADALRDDIFKVLRRCDLVKFARAKPTEDECRELAKRIRIFIDQIASPPRRSLEAKE